MRPAATRVLVPSARYPAANVEVAIRALTFGATAVVLLPSCLTVVAACVLGGRWVLVALALDPRCRGSLPNLWGVLLLSTTLAAPIPAGGRAAGLAHLRLAALTPSALLLAESTSAVAHLASLPGGKVVASAVVGGTASALALALGLSRSVAGRRLGQAVVARLRVWGSAAVALDLLGSAVGSRGLGSPAGHGITVAEEAMESLPYASFSAGFARPL